MTPAQIDAIKQNALANIQKQNAQKAKLVEQVKASGTAGVVTPREAPAVEAPAEEQPAWKKYLLYGALGVVGLGGSWFAYKKFKGKK